MQRHSHLGLFCSERWPAGEDQGVIGDLVWGSSHRDRNVGNVEEVELGRMATGRVGAKTSKYTSATVSSNTGWICTWWRTTIG